MENVVVICCALCITSYYTSSHSTFNSLCFLVTLLTAHLVAVFSWCDGVLSYGVLWVSVCVFTIITSHNYYNWRKKTCWRQLSFQAVHLFGMQKKAHTKTQMKQYRWAQALQQFAKVKSNEDRTELGLSRLLKWRVWIQKGSLRSRAYEVQYECYNRLIWDIDTHTHTHTHTPGTH